jgi:ATP-dependent helicase HrpA
MPVVVARRLYYAQLDPMASREMFIWHALVEGDWQAAPAFVAGNHQVLDDLVALARRCRRQDLLVGGSELFDFYDARLGPEVTSGQAFSNWWSRQGVERSALELSPEDLAGSSGLRADPAEYPERWVAADGPALTLGYNWEPGSQDDGVSVEVPLARFGALAEQGLEWQVPGLREELVVALVRSLPKDLRRHLVPLPERAAEFVAKAGPADGPLPEVLSRELSTAAGVVVRPEDFDWRKVPAHLRPTFHVVGEDGQELAVSKDLGELWADLGPLFERALAQAVHLAALARTGLKSWELDELPKVFEPVWQGCRLRGYPALVDEGTSVSVQVFTDQAAQAEAMLAGTRRLLLLSIPSRVQRLDRLERLLDNPTKLALGAGSNPPYRSARELVDDVAAAAVDQVIVACGGPAWSRESFEALREAVAARFDAAVSKAVVAAGRVISQLAEVRNRVEALAYRVAPLPASAPLRLALADVEHQLAGFAGPRFVSQSGLGRLGDMERYLLAIERRLERLPRDPGRDAALALRVQALQDRLAKVLGTAQWERARPGEPEEVRWMIEELRVSLFAQAIGTRVPVSEERVLRAIDSLVVNGQ